MVAYIVEGSTVSIASSRSYTEPLFLSITAMVFFRLCVAVIFDWVGLHWYIWESDGKKKLSYVFCGGEILQEL